VIETLLSAVTVAICTVLLVRLLLRPPARRKLDAFGRMAWHQMGYQLRTLPQLVTRRRQAKRDAAEAIRRAQAGEWQGNVYTPKAFKDKEPRKPH
jgi:hypothetical protein